MQLEVYFGKLQRELCVSRVIRMESLIRCNLVLVDKARHVVCSGDPHVCVCSFFVAGVPRCLDGRCSVRNWSTEPCVELGQRHPDADEVSRWRNLISSDSTSTLHPPLMFSCIRTLFRTGAQTLLDLTVAFLLIFGNCGRSFFSFFG